MYSQESESLEYLLCLIENLNGSITPITLEKIAVFYFSCGIIVFFFTCTVLLKKKLFKSTV